jgi:protein TonB
MKRALLSSCCAHIAIAILLYLGSLNFRSAEPALAVYDVDLSLVELSAFETELPKGDVGAPKQAVSAPAPRQAPPVATALPEISFKMKQKREPKKERVQPTQPNVAQSSTLNAVPSGSPKPPGMPVGGGTAEVEKARVSYHDLVATKLARAKRYPERALRKQITGAGVLKVTIAPVGEVVSVEVLESTSSPILDEELQSMVARAAPFPAFPSGLSSSSVVLVVPVSFRIES